VFNFTIDGVELSLAIVHTGKDVINIAAQAVLPESRVLIVAKKFSLQRLQ